MNERIRELAEQASSYAWKMAGDSYHGVSNVSDRQMEEWEIGKFAELIVKECLDTLYNNGYDDAALKVTEHFNE